MTGVATRAPGAATAAPAIVDAEVVAVEPWGGYTRVELSGDPLGAARPGQFVAVATGGPDTAMVAARAFGVHRADPGAGTLSLVVAGVGTGSRWIAARRPGERVRVTGPLGRAFDLSGPGGTWIGVGGGYGSAAMAWAAREAVAAGARAFVVAGASTAALLCDLPALEEALGAALRRTTDDGSAGTRGTVLAALTPLLDEVATPSQAAGPGVTVTACGPMRMLAAVAAAVGRHPAAGRMHVEVAVEERMACGVGICMTCVLPVVDGAGETRMVRACTDGPTLPAGAVRWDAVGPHGSTVPSDAVGAVR